MGNSGLEPLEPRRLFAAIHFDKSFGNAEGVAFNPLGPGEAIDYSVEFLQPFADGKFLVAGGVGEVSQARAARINADGSPDTTFGGGDGFLELLGLSDVTDALLQPDGKLVVVSSHVVVGSGTDELAAHMAAFRVNADGTPDASFGDNGLVVLPLPAGMGQAYTYAVAQQGDGKLVLGGYAVPPGGGPPTTPLVRLNTDGSIDTSFGNDGTVIIANNTTLQAEVSLNDLAITPEGKILFIGQFDWSFLEDRAYIGRYNADGTPDTTFGGATFPGFVYPGDATLRTLDEAWALALVPGGGGDFLVGGLVDPRSDGPGEAGVAAIARFNADGSADTAFGDGGIVKSGLGVYHLGELRVQGDGKIVALGGTGQNIAAVYRLTPDGELDSSFNGNGEFSTGHIGDPYPSLFGLAIADDGDVLVGGQNLIVRAGERPDLLLSGGGTLVLTGGEGDDAFSIDIVNGNTVIVRRDGAEIASYPVDNGSGDGDVLELDIDLGGGDDTLTLSGGLPGARERDRHRNRRGYGHAGRWQLRRPGRRLAGPPRRRCQPVRGGAERRGRYCRRLRLQLHHHRRFFGHDHRRQRHERDRLQRRR